MAEDVNYQPSFSSFCHLEELKTVGAEVKTVAM